MIKLRVSGKIYVEIIVKLKTNSQKEINFESK